MAIAEDADFQVLQETAVARRVMVKCGSSEMDGFAFYSGLSGSALSYKDDLRPLVYTTGYLMRGSLSRRRHAIGNLISPEGALSLQIRLLCELVDMFHAKVLAKAVKEVYRLAPAGGRYSVSERHASFVRRIDLEKASYHIAS